MPPRSKYTREEILQVVLEMTRENGFEAVTAREIGKRLGMSSTPIFTLFKNMDEVKGEVRKLAMKEFESYVADALNYTPAFKYFGMKMIEFAMNEPKLFRILYMQENDKVSTFEGLLEELGDSVGVCIELIKTNYSLSEEEARILFEQVWLHTFSICVLIVNKICNISKEEASKLLSMEFQGELMVIKSGKYKDCVVKVMPR